MSHYLFSGSLVRGLDVAPVLGGSCLLACALACMCVCACALRAHACALACMCVGMYVGAHVRCMRMHACVHSRPLCLAWSLPASSAAAALAVAVAEGCVGPQGSRAWLHLPSTKAAGADFAATAGGHEPQHWLPGAPVACMCQ
eukprot:1160578-Pelagomonas_calceolata.AAC.10